MSPLSYLSEALSSRPKYLSSLPTSDHLKFGFPCSISSHLSYGEVLNRGGMHRVCMRNRSARLWSIECKSPGEVTQMERMSSDCPFVQCIIINPVQEALSVRWPDRHYQMSCWTPDIPDLLYLLCLKLCNFKFPEKKSCYLVKTVSVSQCLHLEITHFSSKFLQIVCVITCLRMFYDMGLSSTALPFLKTFLEKLGLSGLSSSCPIYYPWLSKDSK